MDRPIFSGVTQDDEPDVMPVPTFMERKRTPLLEPIMESSQLPRAQRRRCKPPWLEDYKLRRVKRTHHSQLCSPTDENCSNVLKEASDPTLRESTLRCNMIRSEVHDTRRQERCSDSFNFAHQVFGDGVARRGAPMSEPRRGVRRCDFRAATVECRHVEEQQCQHYDQRYIQDVPFGRQSSVPPPMGSRDADMRPWGERLRRPGSPRFERGWRSFRGRGLAKGWPFMQRGRTPPRATTSASAGQHERAPRPYVALDRVDADGSSSCANVQSTADGETRSGSNLLSVVS